MLIIFFSLIFSCVRVVKKLVRFWAFVKDRTLKTVWWITSIVLVCGKQCHRVKCYVRYQNENENIADPVHNASKGRIIFNWATVSACFWREWYWTVSRFNRAYYINKLAFSFCLLLVGCYFSKFPLSASHFAAFFLTSSSAFLLLSCTAYSGDYKPSRTSQRAWYLELVAGTILYQSCDSYIDYRSSSEWSTSWLFWRVKGCL